MKFTPIALLLTLSCVTRASEETLPEACAGYDLLHVANGDLSSASSIFMHSTENPDRSDAQCAAAIIKNSSHKGDASVHMSYGAANVLLMREFLNALCFQFVCIGNLKDTRMMKKSGAHYHGPKIYLGNGGVSTAAFLRKKPQQPTHSADHRNYTKGKSAGR